MGQLITPRRLMGPRVAGLGSGGYTAFASDFDGTNDFMKRGADLTGIVDGKKGIISVWVNWEGADASSRVLYTDNTNRMLVQRDSDEEYRVQFQTSASSDLIRMETVGLYNTADGWHHLLASWDVGTAGAHNLYISDVSDKNVVTFTDGTIDYTHTEHAIGALTSGSAKFDGCLAELYMNFNEYLDFSVEANRRLFIDSAGKPVNLGSDGSTPTGTAPIIYFNNAFGTFEKNKGTGGDFTVTGALTECASSPSD